MNDLSSAVRLFRVRGIEVRLHVSVLIIYLLIVAFLGTNLFPRWHADWGPETIWLTALVTATLFLTSLLAHELAHSMVAKGFGISVPRITLFLFGGMAEMEREPPSPKAEFWIAAAGPLMSLALSMLCFAIAGVLVPDTFPELLKEDPTAAFAGLSIVASACLWLASVNFILAAFNLLPGFPMDGGRVFRAILWWRSGNLMLATQRAAFGGRVVGWTLVGLGFLTIARGSFVDGLWLAAIGWFISHLARASVSQFVLDRALRELSVSDLMRTRFDRVDADLPIEDFVHDLLLRSGQTVWPVESRGATVGLVNLANVAGVAKGQRRTTLVGDVMTPLANASHLDPGLRGGEALRRTAESGDDPLLVVEGRDVVGMLHPADIIKWMNLHELESN